MLDSDKTSPALRSAAADSPFLLKYHHSDLWGRFILIKTRFFLMVVGRRNSRPNSWFICCCPGCSSTCYHVCNCSKKTVLHTDPKWRILRLECYLVHPGWWWWTQLSGSWCSGLLGVVGLRLRPLDSMKGFEVSVEVVYFWCLLWLFLYASVGCTIQYNTCLQ